MYLEITRKPLYGRQVIHCPRKYSGNRTSIPATERWVSCQIRRGPLPLKMAWRDSQNLTPAFMRLRCSSASVKQTRRRHKGILFHCSSRLRQLVETATVYLFATIWKNIDMSRRRTKVLMSARYGNIAYLLQPVVSVISDGHRWNMMVMDSQAILNLIRTRKRYNLSAKLLDTEKASFREMNTRYFYNKEDKHKLWLLLNW